MAVARPWSGDRQSRQNASIGRPSLGSGLVGIAIVAAAGVVAMKLIGANSGPSSSRTSAGLGRRSAVGHEPEVQRSITIEDVSPDELYRR